MKRHASGFTLLELVVTVAIVGILASVAVPLGEISVHRAKEQELRSALRQIREALDAYKLAAEDGRVQRRADGNGYPRSLDELAGGVEDAKSPVQSKLFFLRRLPRDPFYPESSAPAADTWGKRAYASPPDAPTEGEDVFDVYSRSGRVGLNGIAYRAW
jgi:general secretion pathway protein G